MPFIVSPHFSEAEREILKEQSKTISYPVIPITDIQAVCVKGDKWEIVGTGEKIIL